MRNPAEFLFDLANERVDRQQAAALALRHRRAAMPLHSALNDLLRAGAMPVAADSAPARVECARLR